jgi:hypothetical protein
VSNVTLSLNGSTAPSTFQVGSTFILAVLVDGNVPASVRWSYGLRYGPKTIGMGSITFLPVHAEPYYLHITTTLVSGLVLESVFILNVTVSGASAAEVTIRWSDPAPKAAAVLSAAIHVSGTLPPRSIGWTHFFNGVQFDSGHGAAVAPRQFQPGVHRLFATVVDHAGNTVIGDSSLSVPSAFGLQSAVVPTQPVNSSLIYLGCVYSPVIEGCAGLATALPFAVASFDGAVKLIPGSTHFALDFDPELNTVDDEVVVRTQLGNWTLVGPPAGLTSETLPYDYQHGQPFQPSPLDLSVRYGIDVWNAHSASVGAFKFRVRFRCFRAGDAVYRYTPCEWSSYNGGTGERQRRLIGLVTNVDLSLDDESPTSRLGSQQIETFTVQKQGYIIGTASTTGAPDRPVLNEDHFYTDQNTLAIYEAVNDLGDLPVHGIYGMPSVRPCVLDFSKQDHPRIVNKVKRLWGSLLLYLSGGALTQGTVVTVRIYTGAQPGYVDVPITVTENVYNPDYTGFVKAAEGAIDLSDFEFDRLGVTMDFVIDESHAGTAVPSSDPMMVVGEDFLYTKVNAPAVRIDTACFRDPVLMPTFEGTFLGSAVPLGSCNTLVCGPIGTYCYVEVAGTGTYQALQPLGYPAPFIAPYTDSAHCYGNPSFMGEYFGTVGGYGGLNKAQDSVFGFTGTTGCGAAYQYNPCSAAVGQQLAVIFPTSSTPHTAVSYQGFCYTLVGRVHDTRQLVSLPLSAVSPVSSCTDSACTGSNAAGGSIDYVDQEAFQQVTVAFPHLDKGIPFFAVAPESFSQGYGNTPPGSINWALYSNPIFKVMTAPEDATLVFEITPRSILRELVVTHLGTRSHYRFYPGLAQSNITVQAGDTVTLEFGNRIKVHRGISGQVLWHKQVVVPYLYDTAALTLSPSTGTLTALGFCGLDNRQDYCFYGTLGVPVEMDQPNPDAVVTVKDNSSLPEMVLVRTKQPHEVPFQFDMPSYQAQCLHSPLTFRFYATRQRTGAHGEMDVWLNRDNTVFPAFFRVSNFKSLALTASPYRKTTQQSDTTRRSLRVITSNQADALTSPRIHVDTRGNRISVVTNELNDYVFMPGNSDAYTFSDLLDYGISETIYSNLQGGGGPQMLKLWNVSYRPRGLCYVDSQDEVWVAIPDSGMVVIFSGDGMTLKQTLTVTDRPFSVAYSPASDCVAVICQTTGMVNLFDAASRTQVQQIDTQAGAFYQYDSTLISYNPTTQNFYVCGVPSASYMLYMYEVNPSTGQVRSFLLIGSAVSLESLFYCQTTMETIAATESGGSFAFNVNTTISENLGIPVSTCRGACDAPEIARCLFTNAANPPGDVLILYDPRSRSVRTTYGYEHPTRATGWHPKRRKFYLSSLSAYAGGPGISIVSTTGKTLLTLPNFDWGYNWVYSPKSKVMFNTIPQNFYSASYVGVFS